MILWKSVIHALLFVYFFWLKVKSITKSDKQGGLHTFELKEVQKDSFKASLHNRLIKAH